VLGEIVPVNHATCLKEAISRLRSGQFRVILTEAELRDGGCRDALRISQQTASPSQVVVTNPFVGARFWADVINLGAFDMLAQPFDRAEIHRILQSAWNIRIPPRLEPQPDTLVRFSPGLQSAHVRGDHHVH
jgi:DNA-binding NarL/FixJ family response regulator